MLKITEGKGFQVTYENGVTVSVQFGYFSYCNNRMEGNIGTEKNQTIYKCENAEVAILKDHNYITRKFKDEGDDVLGWQTPEQILEAMNWAANYKD